ncbi:LysE/ArgO family amino acid transporter [Microbacterium sp. YY-01]|uniref:LysE/ArgO family amino acid transporter n=1 Tax=Microbacterium sp. YY-01 TaxID=3421634 RepID=UPI003D162997
MLALVAGLGLGLSLIIAIGAQNVFLLRQGIRREHVLAVVLVCFFSDAALIAVGVAGLGALVTAVPWLIPAARWLGAAFLIGYGILAARRAWRPATAGLQIDDAQALGQVIGQEKHPDAAAATSSSRRTAILTVLALTWLNPHVYFDTVLLVGSVAATYAEERWLFGIGAIIASGLWFFALGFGARVLRRWLRTPRAWRVLDAVIAVVMIALGVGLVLPVLTG